MLSFDNVQNKHQHIKFISFNGIRRHFIRSRQQQTTFYFTADNILFCSRR